jgi:hypothetical protein
MVSRASVFLWLVLLCLANHLSTGQDLAGKDTAGQYRVTDSLDFRKTVRTHFHHELDYSFSINDFLLFNWLHDNNVNQLMGQQSLKYRVTADGKVFCFSNLFTHNLGVQYYFDSIAKVCPDDNTLKTKIDLYIKGKYSLVFLSNLTSRCMKGFDYSTDDSGRQVRTLNSAFLTPLIWTFSCGFGITWKDFGSLNAGISGGKLTYIRQTRIFAILHTTEFWGVPAGKNHLFEYGLSLQLLVNKDFLKRVHWDCDLLLFKNYNTTIDLSFKNLIGIRINKFLKTSIQTRVLYEEKVSRNLQMENLVSLGFYVHL